MPLTFAWSVGSQRLRTHPLGLVRDGGQILPEVGEHAGTEGHRGLDLFDAGGVGPDLPQVQATMKAAATVARRAVSWGIA